MKTVLLFRHAKASRDAQFARDFDRPLIERGQIAAARMGAYMAAAGLRPGLIVCSPSVRTRQTLELALKTMGPAPECLFDESFYHASASSLLASLRALPGGLNTVMIVGHNPGLHALALDLAGSGDHSFIRRLARKFPTAALAEIEFASDGWQRLQVGEGRLIRFVTPRQLEDTGPAAGET
jgi:phosphohistidine phosphatase